MISNHKGPNLPRPMSGHCMEIINNTKIFLLDPNQKIKNSTRTFIYDIDDETWIAVNIAISSYFLYFNILIEFFRSIPNFPVTS